MSWTDDKEAYSQRIRAEIAEETLANIRSQLTTAEARVCELEKENSQLKEDLSGMHKYVERMRGQRARQKLRISQLEEGLREIANDIERWWGSPIEHPGLTNAHDKARSLLEGGSDEG